jgi:hypothetical protein
MNKEHQVADIIADSLIVRTFDRAIAAVERGAASSWFVGRIARIRAVWREWPWPVQRFAAGVALLTAVAVHVGLTLWKQAPPGFWWLILPGIAAAAGGALLLASGSGKDIDAAQ